MRQFLNLCDAENNLISHGSVNNVSRFIVLRANYYKFGLYRLFSKLQTVLTTLVKFSSGKILSHENFGPV